MYDRIWISFDLSASQDRSGMYRWLAVHDARDCGPGLASLVFYYQDDLVSDLRQELAREVELRTGDRVYVIYKDPEDGEVTGRFLFGQRNYKKGQVMTRPFNYTQLN